MTHFGDWIRRERLARGWTAAYLARRAGLSQSCITSIEIGTRRPTLTTAARISRALGMDLWEALREIQNPA